MRLKYPEIKKRPAERDKGEKVNEKEGERT